MIFHRKKIPDLKAWWHNCRILSQASHDGDGNEEMKQRKTKHLLGRAVAQHVRFETFHISEPSSANQQRENIKIFVSIWVSIWNSTPLTYVTLKSSRGVVTDGNPALRKIVAKNSYSFKTTLSVALLS